MIVKVCFGDKPNHTRIIECNDIHLEYHANEEEKPYTVMLCHRQGSDTPCEIHLGKTKKTPPFSKVDHVYIMDNGKTVDKMVFYRDAVKPTPENIED